MRLSGVLRVMSCFAVGACVSDSNSNNDAGTDATSDVQSDVAQDVAKDVAADAGTTYAQTIADQSRWEKFDITPVAGSKPNFAGGAFDGRYVYLSPTVGSSCCNSLLVRYDTQASFTTVNSWDGFDLSPLGIGGAAATVFAAPYLYIIPYRNPTMDGRFLRFDTSKNFKDVTSYQVVDLATIDPSNVGFGGTAFDGKYVYMTSARGGSAARYDTTAPFDAGTSYQRIATSTNNTYYAGAFDGTRVYMTPYQVLSPSAPLGLLQMYDTSKAFTAFASYDLLDGGVDPNAGAFGGVVFDSRYLYFVPYGMTGTASLVVRYDTQSTFANANSYSKFDLVSVDPNAHGFEGATFDGRYAYFAPTTASTTVRFDTTATFGDKAAWQSYDLSTSLTSNARNFQGAVFDGQYVYYVPNTTALVVRFNAKTPASLPPFRSSFF